MSADLESDMAERLAALKAEGVTAQYWLTVPNLIRVGDEGSDYELADGTIVPSEEAKALISEIDPATYELYPPPAVPTETVLGVSGIHDPYEIDDTPVPTQTHEGVKSHGSNPIQRR